MGKLRTQLSDWKQDQIGCCSYSGTYTNDGEALRVVIVVIMNRTASLENTAIIKIGAKLRKCCAGQRYTSKRLATKSLVGFRPRVCTGIQNAERAEELLWPSGENC